MNRTIRDYLIGFIIAAVVFLVAVVAKNRIEQSRYQSLSRAIDTVNVGTGANTGTGDPLRTAFIKVNRLIVMMDSLGIDDLTTSDITTLAAVAEIADTTEVAVSLSEYEVNMGNYLLRELQASGADIKALPISATQVATAYKELADGTAYYTLFYLPLSDTITGVKFIQRTQGGYTAADSNYVALYSVSGTTYTKVATSISNGNLWKGTSYSLQTVPFTSAYVATAGLYMVGFTYNQSAQTTAPSIYSWNGVGAISQLITGGHKLTGTVAAQANLPASETAGDITGGDQVYGVWLY